jgi:hypothetical protein
MYLNNKHKMNMIKHCKYNNNKMKKKMIVIF